MRPLPPLQRLLTMGTNPKVARTAGPHHRFGRRRTIAGSEIAAPGLNAVGAWVGLSLLLALLSGAGCQLLKTTTGMPGKAISTISPGQKGKGAVDPAAVQQTLFRFADQFATGMVLGAEKLRHGTNAAAPAEILQWKIAFVTEICSIASGPNATADLLDLTVFVSVTRAAVEEHWQPNVFGESAQTMLEDCRAAETNIWQIAAGVLTPRQQTQLREAIERWRRENPLPENALAARALGLAAEVIKSDQAHAAAPGGFLDLLNLDPLSGLDPATREIAQMRLLAERGLYVSQKLPLLLRWQAELLSLQAADLPAAC